MVTYSHIDIHIASNLLLWKPQVKSEQVHISGVSRRDSVILLVGAGKLQAQVS